MAPSYNSCSRARLSQCINETLLRTLLHLWVVLTLAQTVASYNINVDELSLLKPPSQTGIQFGFALTPFYNSTERRLLVGAPRANTMQEGVVTPGDVFTCSLRSPKHCQQMFVDEHNADDKYHAWITEDIKDNQGLGYTVVSNNESIVACAPHWYAFETLVTGKTDLPYGICFAAKAPEFKFERFSPSSDSSIAANYQTNGSCQFGMSASYVKGQDSIAFGSPGCWIWQGDTWDINIDSLGDSKRLVWRAMQMKLEELGVHKGNRQGFSTAADLYLGYSVASMMFAGESAILSAMPRTVSTRDLKVLETEANQTLGPMVHIFSRSPEEQSKLHVLTTLKPNMKQVAPADTVFSYYGYSLTTADLNADGLDDVVVGAPLYHQNSSYYDQGAIFVYMQKKYRGADDTFEYQMEEEKDAPRRKGRDSKSRFGTCVAAVGDLDDDGFQDIAVGAPFFPGGGAVFIYRGSGDGLRDDPSQVIYAESLSLPLRGFGHSIAENLRGDFGKGYDLAVGAHESDTVIVFTTYEIIVIDWNLAFSGELDLEQATCVSLEHGILPCVYATITFQFHTKNTKAFPRENLDINFTLKADPDNQRIIVGNGNSSRTDSMTLQRDKTSNYTIALSAKKNTEGWAEKPIKISVDLEVSNEVILDEAVQLYKQEELKIVIRCEGNEQGNCKSDINLDVQLPQSLQEYALMSSQKVQLNFIVQNFGETAFNTKLTVDSSGDLKYWNSTGNFSCVTDSKDENITCTIDSAFSNNTMANFSMLLQPTTKFFDSLKEHPDLFIVKAQITTDSDLINSDNANKIIEIPISVKGRLDIVRSSVPDELQYNGSDYFKAPSEAQTEEELGELVTHTYGIYNKYNYPIYEWQVIIKWPLKINGLYLLYLLNMPEFVNAQPSCRCANGEIDEFNVTHSLQRATNQTTAMSPCASTNRGAQPLGIASGTSKLTVEFMEISCTFKELKGREEVSIIMRSRFVQTTLKKLQAGVDVGEVSSTANVIVLLLPLGAPPPEDPNEAIITTTISYSHGRPEETSYIPWWVYLLAVLGGILILLLIVLVLWKVGFFKRNTGKEANEQTEDGEGGGEDGNAEGQEPKEGDPMMRHSVSAGEEFEFQGRSSKAE